jgi:hypothetical protein
MRRLLSSTKTRSTFSGSPTARSGRRLSALRQASPKASKVLCEALEERQLMSLTIAIRDANGNNSISNVTVGQVLSLEVDAIITGPSSEDSLNFITGSIIGEPIQPHAVAGNLAAIVSFPFTNFSYQNGTQQDLLGDGNTDVGSNNASTISGYFFGINTNPSGETLNSVDNETEGEIKVGTLTYTVTHVNEGGETDVSFRLRPGGNGNGYNVCSWTEGGSPEIDDTGTINLSPFVITNPASIPNPAAVSESVTLPKNTASDINLLSKDDHVVPFNTSSVTIVSAAAHGTTQLQSDGSILYTPVTNYLGADSFTYTVADTGGRVSNQATVSITVVPTPAPTAGYVSSNTYVDQPVTINVLSHDSSVATLVPGSVAVASQPAHGNAVAQADGTIIYTPSPGYTGADAFTYSVSDSNGETSAASTVTIITSAPVHPAANDDSFNVIAGTPATLNVLGNDVEGSIATNTTVHLVSNASHGTLIVQTDQSVLYTPTPGYTGTDTFSYLLTDAIGDASSPATVTLSIGAAPPPAAAAVVAPVLSGTTGTIDVLSSVTGQAPIVASSVKVVSPPTDGTATVNISTGAIAYVPITGFIGTDTFTYTAADTNGVATAPATVTVNVGTSISAGKGQTHLLSFTDAAGGVETISLNVGTAEIFFSGTGSLTTNKSRATVAGKSLNLGSIELTGTTRASSLSIRGSTRTPVTLGGISDASPLGSINASGASVSGTISLNSAASITLGNISDATITIAAGAPGRTSLAVGTVTDSSLTSSVPIASLRAASWTTTASNSITAPSIGSLQIAGQFNVGLTLTGAGKASDLSSARISGAVSGGAWNVSGSVGTVTAGSIASAWSGTLHNINAFAIKTGGLSSTLSAGTIGLLSIGGDLTGSIDASGAVQTVRVSGAVTNASAGFATTVGSFIVGGAVYGSSISSGGNVRSISVGSIIGSSVAVGTVTPGVGGSFTLLLENASSTTVGSSTLGSFRSGSFAATTIEAGSVVSASLGTIDTADSGTEFGIGTKKLSSFAGIFSSTTVRLGHSQLANEELLNASLQEQAGTTGDFGIVLES